MFVAFALRTEPELEFVQLLFSATEPECKAAVAHLCEQFADDILVELDWVGFPGEPMPSPEQILDPSYIQAVHERIIEAFTDDPIELELKLEPELEPALDTASLSSHPILSQLHELHQLNQANLIIYAETSQKLHEILEAMGKRDGSTK